MKILTIQLLYISLILLFTYSANGQDTIIEQNFFTLKIKEASKADKRYHDISIGKEFLATKFSFVNHDVEAIVREWTSVMGLESIDYRIEGELDNQAQILKAIDREALEQDLKNGDSAVIIENYLPEEFKNKLPKRYNVSLVMKDSVNVNLDYKAAHRQAFEIFIKTVGLDIQYSNEEKTFWTLQIVDKNSHAISHEQNKYWRRTELDDFVFYERIPYRRVADLLSRKLDNFVRPIPYNYLKFDIEMPHSDDVFDLKYAMIEHGLELKEVTEIVEVVVIKAKVEEN